MPKIVTRFFFYKISYFVARVLSFFYRGLDRRGNEKIIIFRPDAIGDYLLFQNFIPLVKKDNVEIILVGNSKWMELAGVNESFTYESIDRVKFSRDFFYRVKFLLNASCYSNVQAVLYPCYSREGVVFEDFVRIISSSRKVAWFGDTVNHSKISRYFTSKIYTDLYSDSKKDCIVFEFYRNRMFFSSFLGKDINIDKPTISFTASYNMKLPEKYALLFIGASTSIRKWSPSGFSETASYLKNKFGLDIVLCGGQDDVLEGELISDSIKGTHLNLVGKTTQLELLEIISSSVILISNETAIPHIAMALDHPNVFVIYNGSHYGRFVPYPENFKNYHLIAHPSIHADLNSYKINSNKRGFNDNPNINDISSSDVISIIESKVSL